MLLLAVAGAALRLAAQATRDPLNPDEVDQLKDAGAFDKRVALLLSFAHQRLTDFEQIRTETPRPPDRANKLYELLRQYEQILPEIDDNLDDAAAGHRTSADTTGKVDVGKAADQVITAESDMRTLLAEIQNQSTASDLATYHFVLQDCFDTTDDSLEHAHDVKAAAQKKSGGGGPPPGAPAAVRI